MDKKAATAILKSFGYIESEPNWHALLAMLLQVKPIRQHVGHKWCSYPKTTCSCLPIHETEEHND